MLFMAVSMCCLLQEGEICFCENLFSDHKSLSMKQFLQSAVHLQCFKQVNTALCCTINAIVIVAEQWLDRDLENVRGDCITAIDRDV